MLEEKNDNLSVELNETDGSVENESQEVIQTEAQEIAITPAETIIEEENEGVDEVTAETSDGVVMGVRHRDVDVEGVQFHPESILTASGHDLLSRFLQRCN